MSLERRNRGDVHVMPAHNHNEHKNADRLCWCDPTVWQPCTECDDDGPRRRVEVGEYIGVHGKVVDRDCWKCKDSQHPGLIVPEFGYTGPCVVVHNDVRVLPPGVGE